MDETWKEINGFNGYYVSTTGKVRGKSGKVLRPFLDTKGYQIVKIKGNKVASTKKVHRLVAEAFIENAQGKPQINHKDGDKTNNNVENLEWCTGSENQWHRVHVLGKYPKENKNVNPPLAVRCVETGIVYASCKKASKAASVSDTSILKCCRGKWKKCKNLHWEFA